MPNTRGKHTCDQLLRDHITQHNSCGGGNRKGSTRNGKFLNSFSFKKVFEDEKDYEICRTLNYSFTNNRINRPPPPAPPSRPEYSAMPIVSPPLLNQANNREERNVNNEIRKTIYKQNETIEELFCYNEFLRSILAEEQKNEDNDDEEVVASVDIINDDIQQPPTKKTKRNDNKFIETVELQFKKHGFRKSFEDISHRSREARVDFILQFIAAAVVSRKEFNENNKSCKFLITNEKKANEMMNIIMALKDRVEVRFDVDIKHKIEAIEEGGDDDTAEEERIRNRCCVSTAVSFLLETSDRAYKRITSDLQVNMERFYKAFTNVPDFKLPSIHSIRKLLPCKVECINQDILVDASKQSEVNNTINGTTVSVKTEEEILQLFSRPSNFTNKVEQQTNENETSLRNTNNATTVKLTGAKLEGGFDDHLLLMAKKIKSNYPSYKWNALKHLMCTTSFDGAEAFRTRKNLTSVVTMSSFLFTKELLEQGMLTAGTSLDILTWLQLLAKEEIVILDEVTKNYYELRTRFNKKDLKLDVENDGTGIEVYCYDTHDGKMIYELTQHSSWSRKHHPYVLCKCSKGESTKSSNHICQKISDKDYERHWTYSKERFEQEVAKDAEYTKESHRKWCDEENLGITHFGIDPRKFPLSTIRFDVFHLFMAITRKVMGCVRDYTNRRPRKFRNQFTREVLEEIWKSNFHVSVWNNGLAFGCFQGNELFKFIQESEVVISFLRTKLHQSKKIQAVIRLVELLEPMKTFCSISTIGEELISEYPSKIESFERDVKEFHENSITCGVIDEDVESFYMHALVYYLPAHARKTWTLHQLGLGIFNMQGFERRNKESKDTLKRFSTMNRNCAAFLVNNIRRLLTVFWFRSKQDIDT